MRNDFNRSGKFRSLAKSDIVEFPSRGSDIKFATWRLLKQDYIVVGNVTDAGNGMVQVEYELWDVNKQQSLLHQQMPPAPLGDLRGVAHQIADVIYEKITGVRGAFWTRMAYITAVGLGNHTTYSLIVADSDGYNPQVVARSKESLLSPAWSPDGRKLAFVSFADHNGPACPANDSCPSSGEIYVVGADGTGLTRLTTSTADDEHPTWSPDGSRIAFASGFLLASQGHPPWLMTIPSAGGSATRIGRFSGVLDPSWSPAGIR